MAEENLNNLGSEEPAFSSQVVVTSPAESAAPAKPRRRGRKPGVAKKQAVPPPPAKIHRSPIWLSTVANLALLIAIFTIILATHRAIQNNRHASEIVAVETSAEQPQQKVAEEKLAEKRPAQQAEQIVEKTAETIQVEKPVAKPSLKIKKKAVVAKKRMIEDLDMARNLWNNGGPYDLDGETKRQEYKKTYLSATESDSK